MGQDTLGALEFLLLAMLVEQPRDAYGISIMQRVEERSGKVRSLAAIYATLDRLQRKGLVSSWWGEPTEERGGRRKRYYKIEAAGREALHQTQVVVNRFGDLLPAGAGA